MNRTALSVSGFRTRSVPPAGSEPILRLESVGKQYQTGSRAVAAVNNVTLEIAPGFVTALMGPSGSGKTTLLSMMGGILRPSTGSILLCGKDIAELDESDRGRVRLAHVGFVFQSYNLFPALTARQNIEVVLDLKLRLVPSERRSEALRLLDYMGLDDKAESYPADLSGGQKQRIAIARALAGNPALLLADEPTAALDSNNGRRIMKLFRNLAHDEKRAVVIVTHDSRILEFADRILTIEDGCIAADRAGYNSRQAFARTNGAPVLISDRTAGMVAS